MGRFETGGLHFETKCCCPDFWTFARASSWSLERAVVFGSSLEPGSGRSSESLRLVWTCSFAFLARASFSLLERVFLVSGRSSDQVFARASLSSLIRQQRVFNQFFILFLDSKP